MEVFNTISHGFAAIVFLNLLYIYRQNSNLTIFNASATICYGLSALHHSLPTIKLFLYLDHCGIVLLILGTYSPLTSLLMQTKLYLYFASLISVILSVIQIINDRFYPTIYVIVGWFIILGLKRIPRTILTSLSAGGIIYTTALVFNIWSHEVFHVLVVLGTLCHFFVIKHLSGEDYNWKRNPV